MTVRTCFGALGLVAFLGGVVALVAFFSFGFGEQALRSVTSPEPLYAQEGTQESGRFEVWMWNGIDEDDDDVAESGAGWISLHCETFGDCNDVSYGVEVDPDTGALSGHAWAGAGEDQNTVPTISQNEIGFGWLSFDRSDTGNPPFNDPGDGEGPIAVLDFAERELSGWARFLSACKADGDISCANQANETAAGWSGWVKIGGFYSSQNNTIVGLGWNGDDTTGNGVADIGLGRFSIEAQYVNVNVEEELTNTDLMFALTANPSSSNSSSLDSILTATVHQGDAPYDYEFKCEQGDSWIFSADNSNTFKCSYDSEDTYTAQARVTEQGGDQEVVPKSVQITVGDGGGGSNGGCDDDDDSCGTIESQDQQLQVSCVAEAFIEDEDAQGSFTWEEIGEGETVAVNQTPVRWRADVESAGATSVALSDYTYTFTWTDEENGAPLSSATADIDGFQITAPNGVASQAAQGVYNATGQKTAYVKVEIANNDGTTTTTIETACDPESGIEVDVEATVIET